MNWGNVNPDLSKHIASLGLTELPHLMRSFDRNVLNHTVVPFIHVNYDDNEKPWYATKWFLPRGYTVYFHAHNIVTWHHILHSIDGKPAFPGSISTKWHKIRTLPFHTGICGNMTTTGMVHTWDSAIITMTPYEHYGVSNYRRLDCLLSRLFRRRSKKTIFASDDVIMDNKMEYKYFRSIITIFLLNI